MVTSKSDVYAFGVVLFELLCGRPAVDATLDEDQRSLAGWARLCVKRRKVDQIIDPSVKSELLPRSLSTYVKIANRCLNPRPKERPTMTEALAELVLALSLQETGTKNTSSAGGGKIANMLMLLFPFTSRPGLDFDVTEVEPINTEDEPSNLEVESNIIEGSSKDEHSINLDLVGVPSIHLDKLKKITNNFHSNWFVGEGTYGVSHYGILKSGQAFCIKKLTLNAIDPSEDFFVKKVSRLSTLKHENVVELLHYCADGDNRILAYEYAANGSLYDSLHGVGRKGIRGALPRQTLSWSDRVKVAIGAAKGLEYLHEKVQPKIVHRAIKSCKILLFQDNVAKVADVNIWDESDDNSPWPDRLRPIYTTVLSQPTGDVAPEFHWTGRNSPKSNVYSFGVVLLELLTGRKVIDYNMPRGEMNLVSWAIPRLNRNSMMGFVDPRLNGEIKRNQVAKMAAIASRCVQYEPASRPSMSEIVEYLERYMTDTPNPEEPGTPKPERSGASRQIVKPQ